MAGTIFYFCFSHTEIDVCNKNPCQHGRCVNKYGGYKCTCSPGWTGQNCQQRAPLRCQTGWSKYNNHCYKLMKDKVGWYEAKSRCAKHRAVLASIKDAGENNFIAGLIVNAPKGALGFPLVWVGLYRQSGQLKWTDGSRVGYKNWNPDEPENTSMKEDCVNMHSKNARHFIFWRRYKGKWNDAKCNWTYPFVCEKPM
ncbi:aggrecan core protein-like isoform X1 [Branchiostoma floridae x Branchiostoma belcheri]